MIESLAYIGFTSPDPSAWNSFGPQVLGLELAPEVDGVVRLRQDDAAYRIAIHPGERDDLAYMGWAVTGPNELRAVADKLTAAGVEVTWGDEALKASRQVVDLIQFSDPYGLQNEVVWGHTVRPSSFRPGRAHGGFVTGDGGLGHIVLISPDFSVSEAFYCDLLGFRLTDEISGQGPTVHFYHCNPRHHSLAMANIPGITGVHHLMLEVENLDDVGIGLQLAEEAGAEITLSLGRHTNDRMTSFYVRTPAGFEIEYGWGGLLVDEEARPGRYDRISIWGHRSTNGENTPPPPAIIHPVGAEAGANQ